MQDTWATRDLPVLEATVRLLEDSYMVTVSDIAGVTDLEAADVARSLEALDPVYVDFRKTTTGGDPTFWYVLKATPEARRAVGQWPTPDRLIGALAAELSAAASQEADPERKGLLAYAARLIGDTLREAAVTAAARLLIPQSGPADGPEAAPAPARDGIAGPASGPGRLAGPGAGTSPPPAAGGQVPRFAPEVPAPGAPDDPGGPVRSAPPLSAPPPLPAPGAGRRAAGGR
ncbi:MAG: hypothetical protein ACLP7J_01565 [Streptosporangiaceae bacterium]